jgi:hypothetical protein
MIMGQWACDSAPSCTTATIIVHGQGDTSRWPGGPLPPGWLASPQWQLNLLNMTLMIAAGSSNGSPTDVT